MSSLRNFLLVSLIITGTNLFYCPPVLIAEENLARGASYTYAPKANYKLTHDLSDVTKLTDGRHASGRFWTDRSATVGWLASGPIRIEIDLESGITIDSICITSARGKGSEVSYPERADLFVKNGNDLYQYIGDLLTDKDTSDGEYQVRRFCSASHQIVGTAVLLVVKPHGHYTFIDEVEVLGQRTVSIPRKAAEIGLESAEVNAFLDQRYNITPVRKSLRSLAEELKNSVPDPKTFNSDLKNITMRLTEAGDRLDKKQLDSLQEQLIAIRQPWLAEMHKGPLLAWESNPWEVFTPISLPLSPQSSAHRTIELDLISGGTSSTALGVANTTDKPITVQVVHDPKSAGPNVIFREVANVVRQDYRIIGDPLVELPKRGLTILPGQSRQIWVTIAANSAPAGVYNDKIIIAGAPAVITIPLKLKVWGVSLPMKPSLEVNTWSYINWRPIRHLPEKAITDLGAHHVNVFVVHPSYIPWPNYNARNLYGSPDYRSFDNVLSLHPVGSKFLFYLGLNDDPTRYKRIAPYPFLSEDWKKGFIRWYSEWVAHLKKKGIHEDDFALYPFDEPRTEQGFITVIEIAKIIKQFNPRLQIYTTLSVFPDKAADPLFENIDIVQAFEPLLSKVKKVIGSKRKIQIWSYTANGGGKGADPQSFYRFQAWRAFQHGATGIGFWAYADTSNSGTAWDDFDGTRPDYAVIYEGENSIVSSKRWEAWREGVEDYELLLQAKKKVKPGQETREFERRVEGVLKRPDDYRYFKATRRFLLAIASQG